MGASASSIEVCSTSSTSCSKVREGTYSVDEYLREREDAFVELVRVEHVREPMDGRMGFYHDYLTLTIAPFEFDGKKMRQLLIIKAEKGATKEDKELRSREGVGVNNGPGSFRKSGLISITEVKDEKSNVKVAFEVEMEGCRRVPLSTWLEILKSANPVYDLLENNCWLYAYDTLKKLITKMSLLSDSPETKKRLEGHLSELRRPKMVMDAFRGAFSASTVTFVVSAIVAVAVTFVIPDVSGKAMLQCMNGSILSSPIGLLSPALSIAPGIFKVMGMMPGNFGYEILEILLLQPNLLNHLNLIAMPSFLYVLKGCLCFGLVVGVVYGAYRIYKVIQDNRANGACCN